MSFILFPFKYDKMESQEGWITFWNWQNYKIGLGDDSKAQYINRYILYVMLSPTVSEDILLTIADPQSVYPTFVEKGTT